MGALSGLGSGVAANYISDKLLRGLSGFKDQRELQRFRRSLEEWAVEFEQTHDGTIAARGEFAGYVRRCRVVENVIGYVLLPAADGSDEDAFLAGMGEGMTHGIEEACSRRLSPEDRWVVSEFLTSLLARVKDFALSKLPVQEQILLYGLCQLQAENAEQEKLLREGFGVTQEMLAQVLDLLKAAQAPAEEETELPPEFDKLILKCNATLRKSQEKVKVYSWDDLPFDRVYVPPALDGAVRDYDTIFRWKLGKDSVIPWVHSKDIEEKTRAWGTFLSKAEFLKIRGRTSIEQRKEQIDTIFDVGHIIYVIGGAGYGKSLFLQNLCVSPEGLTGYREKPLLILRGDLKRMIRSDGTFKPMTEYLEECLTHTCLQKPEELAHNFLDRCMKAGRCLVLLDALDEVGNDQRNELHQRVVSYFQDANSDNRVCITSRDRGFIPAKEVSCYTISPITVQDVGEYVDRFIALGKFPGEERDRFIHQAENLVEKGFVTGFLTLSLLLAIYKNEQELPANKVALYEKCFEYIANAREKRKKLLRSSSTGEEYDWGILAKLMGEATFMNLARLCTPNNREVPREQIDDLMTGLYQTRFHSQMECRAATEMFLQFCADRTEVFIPSPNSNREYRFFHRSFYEFFYANYLVMYSEKPGDTYREVCGFDLDSELFELLMALYYRRNPGKARELLEYAFGQAERALQDHTSKEGRAFDVLVMLMQAADESDYTERFIQLFMKRGGRISELPLKVGFDLINAVFSKKPGYVEELYREDERFYEDRITRDIVRFLIRNREYYNQLLKIERGFNLASWCLEGKRGFRYVCLLELLPDRRELMERLFERMRTPKYLYGPLKMRGKEVVGLSGFADKVLALPEKEREKVYMVLLSIL